MWSFKLQHYFIYIPLTQCPYINGLVNSEYFICNGLAQLRRHVIVCVFQVLHRRILFSRQAEIRHFHLQSFSLYFRTTFYLVSYLWKVVWIENEDIFCLKIPVDEILVVHKFDRGHHSCEYLLRFGFTDTWKLDALQLNFVVLLRIIFRLLFVHGELHKSIERLWNRNWEWKGRWWSSSSSSSIWSDSRPAPYCVFCFYLRKKREGDKLKEGKGALWKGKGRGNRESCQLSAASTSKFV